MRYEVIERLQALDQAHLIADVASFTEEQLACCLQRLQQLSLSLVQEQRDAFTSRSLIHQLTPYIPFTEREVGNVPRNRAVLILAGGEGSRCGAQGGKGMIPLLGKSLFQRICEKIPPDTPVAVLTSPKNCSRITSFFQEHSYFGLSHIQFFSQSTMPLLDAQGLWFWESPGVLAEGSDGNGSVFQALVSSGVLDSWEKQKVELVHIVPVDNPIANPLDSLLASVHKKNRADLSLLAIQLKNWEEPMGRLAYQEGELSVVEYSELTADQRKQFLFANTGLYTASLSFIRFLTKQKFPLHFVWRSSAWKGEKFLVDALAFTKKAYAVGVLREQYYAALKEKNSIPEIELLLLEREGVNRV